MTPTPTEIADSIDPRNAAIIKVVRHYTLQYTQGDDGEGYPLVDALTPPKDKSIARGIEEASMLAWAVIDEINTLTPPPDHRAAAEEINAYLWTHHGISLSNDTYQQLAAIIAKHAGAHPEISRALGGAVGDRYAEGYAAAREDALAAQPSTAENPNEDSYQRGRFDGIMEYATALSALKPQGGEE